MEWGDLFLGGGGILCGRKKKEWGTFLEKCVVLLWSGESRMYMGLVCDL